MAIREQLSQLRQHAQIFRLGIQQFAKECRRLGKAAGALVHLGKLQVNGSRRLAEHALLYVQLRQPLHRTIFFWRELGDFFVNRDGLGDESVGQKYLRQALKIFQRLKRFCPGECVTGRRSSSA